MLAKEELLLIGYFIAVILFLTSFGVIFFIVFQKRKNKLLLEKIEAEKRFEQEIVQSRLEIQEQTLKNVGWELHDNIGQLLSVANMQLNMLARAVDDNTKTSVIEIKEVVGDSLQEVRALSRTLNNEVVGHRGLEASLKNELARFDRLKVLETFFVSEGKIPEIPQQDAIIVFRICQEFFSNVLKHAGAKKLEVHLKADAASLVIGIHDDGIGFASEEIKKSSGLINMKSRAKLLGAGFELHSAPGKGSAMKLNYLINKTNP